MSDTAAAPALISRATPQDPWLGLDSYSEAESAWFFGRNAERDELLRVIERDLLTVVYGPSGSGKTSLLGAGVFPLLRKKHYLPFRIRLEHGPEAPSAVTQIKQRLLKEIEHRKLKESPLFDPLAAPNTETLWEYLHRVDFWDPATGQFITPVILLDQFEELFTLGAARKDELLDDLVALLEDAKSGPRYKLILTLRQEYLYLLDPLRRRAPAFMHNRYLLGPMKGESALQAVVNPGVEVVTPAVAQDIVRFVVGGKSDPLNELEVEPVLLSLFCRELNEGRKSRHAQQITTRQLEAEQSDILTNFYESSFNGLDPLTRPFIEDRLLTSTGNRTSAPEDDATNANVPTADLNQLESRRLIRREQHLQRPHLELTHDVLTKPAAESRRIRRERQAAEDSAKQLAETRRRQRILLGLVILSLASTLIAGLAYWKATNATHQAETERAKAIAAADAERNASEAAVEARDRAAQSAKEAREQREVAEKALKEALAQKKLADASAAKAEVEKVRAETFARDAQNATGVARQQTDLANERAVKLDEMYTRALRASREARAREFAAYARESIDDDPERSIALAMYAVQATRSEGDTALPVAEDMLHRSMLASYPIHTFRHHRSTLDSVTFNADGRLVLAGSSDHTSSLWDASSGQFLKSFKASDSPVLRVAFETVQDRLSVSDDTGKTFIIDSTSGKTLKITYGPSTRWFQNVVFNATYSQAVIDAGAGNFTLWDATSDRELRTFQTDQPPITSMAFSVDGTVAIVAHESGILALWDVRAGKRKEPALQVKGKVDRIITNRDATRLLVVTSDGGAGVWDSTNGQRLATFPQASTAVFSADSKLVLVGTSSGTVGLWNVNSGRELRRYHGHKDAVLSLAFSPDEQMFVSGSRDATAKLWPVAPSEIRSIATGNGTISSVAFSSDSQRLFALFEQGVFSVFDLSSGKQTLTFRHPEIVRSIAFSSNGLRVLMGSFFSGVELWDPASTRLLPPFKAASDLGEAAFSPGGERIALFDNNRTIEIRNTETGQPLKTFSAADRIGSLTFTPDGRSLLAGLRNVNGILFDAATGKELQRFDGRFGPISFSADGRRFATCDGFQAAVFHIDSSRPIRVFDRQRSVALNPDASLIATASHNDPKITIWDAATNRERFALRSHTGRVTSLAFSPNGKFLASVGDDGLIQIYAMNISDLMALARKRVTRPLTPAECERYFQTATCPPFP